ncbi:hypothetical protein, partial [Providencia manganoxydans]
MKLTKISAVIITTLGLSSAAFASEIPQPPIYNPDSIIHQLPKGEPQFDPLTPPTINPDGTITNEHGKYAYNGEQGYEAAHVLGKQVDKNTDAIKNTNDRIDDVILSGQTIVDRQDAINKKQAEENVAIANNIKNTNDKLETAITDGKTALAETNEKVTANTDAIKDTNTKLDTAITDGKTALAETNEKVTANTDAIKDTNT